MSKTVERVEEGGLIIGGLGVIGFLGLIWLMIYGNMYGNMGFDRLTTTYTNESGYAINGTTYTLTNGASTTGFVSLSVTALYNYTDGSLIGSGNYTVSSTAGTIVGAAGRTANYTNVSATYVVTYKAQGELDTDAVTGNITQGFRTFFGFSNTFFTIAAITLLVFMFVGLLSLVMMIAKKNKGKDQGYSGY